MNRLLPPLWYYPSQGTKETMSQNWMNVEKRKRKTQKKKNSLLLAYFHKGWFQIFFLVL